MPTTKAVPRPPHESCQPIALPGSVPADLGGGVVAIGNFDGVHRGHQAVLASALSIANETGAPPAVLTFEPHPRTVFKPDAPVFRLTPARMKLRLLDALGFAGVFEQSFTKAFSERSAEAFVADILCGDLGVIHVVTGVDFHFGHGREGGPAFLMAAGQRHGFGVTLIDPFRDENAAVVSSSRIRTLLEAGDVVEAAGLLGYRFTAEAEVSRGKQLGRTLGYPTANMHMPPEFALRPGIYAARLRRANGTLHDGVASFGSRPTVDARGEPLLETFVFDFDGDLYGETCAISFFGRLRDEEKFDSLDALKTQMDTDAAQARALLGDIRPVSGLDRDICF